MKSSVTRAVPWMEPPAAAGTTISTVHQTSIVTGLPAFSFTRSRQTR